MARFKEDPNYKYEITEIMGIASPQEDLKSNWVKGVLKTLMTTSDGQEQGVDIRRFDTATNTMGKGAGIRLTPEEANNVCNILLEHGYGSIEILEEQLKRRKEMFE